MQIINIDDFIKTLVNPFWEKWEKFNSEDLKKDFLQPKEKTFNTSAKDWELQESISLRSLYNRYNSSKEIYKTFKKEYFKWLYDLWINFCPYCWKDRITHFKWKNWEFKKLYDIEHFLPRSKFPELSVNPYNLLPVCISCNQRLKSDNNPIEWWKEVFHPYFGFIKLIGGKIVISKDSEWNKIDFSDKINFSKSKISDKSHLDLEFSHSNSHFFHLWEIYLNSKDTNNIFDFIQDKRTKIKDEKQKFKRIKKTDKEWIGYFFDNYYPKDTTEILKYSNGKLKMDLIDNIDI